MGADESSARDSPAEGVVRDWPPDQIAGQHHRERQLPL